MERLTFILFLIFSWQLGMAQLVFDQRILPDPNDSLTYLKDIVNTPDNFENGTNQTWDFRFLQTPLYKTKTLFSSPFFTDPSQEGFSFILDNEALDYIYVRKDQGIEEIGFLLSKGKKSSRVFPVYYEKPMYWDIGSLQFGERIVLKTVFSFPMERKDLPRDIQKDIPVSLTEFTFKGSKTVIKLVDASGTLLFPGESIKANRVRVIETIDIRIYNTKSGKLIPYFDNEMIRRIIPMKPSRRYYEFYSKNYKFITAKIELDDRNYLNTIDFQTRKKSSNPINASSSGSGFILYPNPTYNIAKIYVSKRPKGKYGLAIYNIIGKKLWQRDIDVDGDTIIKENFGFLPKGTYLLSLLDENGNILRTTRLIIISV